MTQLLEALDELGLSGEMTLADRWVKLDGECCAVYVAEAVWGGFYTWCDAPNARAVEFYHDPYAAIQAGLRRAARSGSVADRTDR